MTLDGTSGGQPSQRQQKQDGNFSDAVARRDAEDNASVGRRYSSEWHYATAADSVLGSRTCSINALPQWQCSLMLIRSFSDCKIHCTDKINKKKLYLA